MLLLLRPPWFRLEQTQQSFSFLPGKFITERAPRLLRRCTRTTRGLSTSERAYTISCKKRSRDLTGMSVVFFWYNI